MSTASILISVLFLVVIGAFIGGITNHLAIKMLFRPYRAIYIGKFRIPLTPGVIPKRHDEIAGQLGNLVIQHLITAEGIEKRLLDDQFKQVIQLKITAWAERYLNDKRPSKEDLNVYFQIEEASKNTETALIESVQGYMTNFLQTRGHHALEDILTEDFLTSIERQWPALSKHFAAAIRSYFKSDEAKEIVKNQLDQFFQGREMLGNMLTMFLGNQSAFELVYPNLIKFLDSPTIQSLIKDLLEQEWEIIKGQSINELSESFHLVETAELAVQKIIKASPLRELVENPGHLLFKLKQPILEKWIAIGVEVLLKRAAVEASALLQSLELDSLVSDQVRAFSLKELEDVILMISKKEFKMITYLGALLGGIIGFVQAIIMFVIQK